VCLAQEILAYRKQVVSCRFAETHYNLYQHSVEAIKVSLLIVWKNLNSLMILAVVITNASKTGRTDVFGRTAYL
jgi:hypothetical protein